MELKSAKVRALRILGSRAMSANEIEKRLINKGESAETAHEVVKWLEETGAVNDSDLGRIIVNHYSSKGYGIAKIKDELYRRGVPRDLWDTALENLEKEAHDDAAVVYLEKKLRGSSDKDDLRRAENALCRRGFSYDDARSAVKKYLELLEEAEAI
jgi:regulatory protein